MWVCFDSVLASPSPFFSFAKLTSSLPSRTSWRAVSLWSGVASSHHRAKKATSPYANRRRASAASAATTESMTAVTDAMASV